MELAQLPSSGTVVKGSVTAVLLVGGQGTRIRALFPDVPKPMVPVLGRPFLHWPTAHLAHHGVRRFVYSTGFKGEQIETWCADQSMPGLDRRVCHEQQPLGTGGGLLNSLDECGEWVLVANGDTLCLGGVPELLALTADQKLSGGIIGVHNDDTSRYGSLDIDNRGRLVAFREKAAGHGYINAGTYLLRKAPLLQTRMAASCSIEHDLIPTILARGAQMQAVLLKDAPFIDIGTPETVAEADAFIRTHRDAFLWSR